MQPAQLTKHGKQSVDPLPSACDPTDQVDTPDLPSRSWAALNRSSASTTGPSDRLRHETATPRTSTHEPERPHDSPFALQSLSPNSGCASVETFDNLTTPKDQTPGLRDESPNRFHLHTNPKSAEHLATYLGEYLRSGR
jgi:hypothetical protein